MVQNERETLDRQTPSRLLRVVLDGVSYRWAAWGLTAHAALTLGGTVWAAWHAVFVDGYTEAYDLYVAIGIGPDTRFCDFYSHGCNGFGGD